MQISLTLYLFAVFIGCKGKDIYYIIYIYIYIFTYQQYLIPPPQNIQKVLLPLPS